MLIQGRLRAPTHDTTVTGDAVTIRVDDGADPAFWLAVTLDRADLAALAAHLGLRLVDRRDAGDYGRDRGCDAPVILTPDFGGEG